MRTIVIPQGFLTVAGAAEGEITFAWFVRRVLDMGARFNESGKGVRTAVRIERALAKATASLEDPARVTCFLEESDWAELRDEVEKPSGSYPLSPARVAAEYIDAICDAKA